MLKGAGRPSLTAALDSVSKADASGKFDSSEFSGRRFKSLLALNSTSL